MKVVPHFSWSLQKLICEVVTTGSQCCFCTLTPQMSVEMLNVIASPLQIGLNSQSSQELQRRSRGTPTACRALPASQDFAAPWVLWFPGSDPSGCSDRLSLHQTMQIFQHKTIPPFLSSSRNRKAINSIDIYSSIISHVSQCPKEEGSKHYLKKCHFSFPEKGSYHYLKNVSIVQC